MKNKALQLLQSSYTATTVGVWIKKSVHLLPYVTAEHSIGTTKMYINGIYSTAKAMKDPKCFLRVVYIEVAWDG